MSINVDDLKAFLAAVDAGSVVGAAERIHLSQSAVSRRLQSLEDALQTQLLLRESRPLQPTAAGKQAYAAAAKIITSIEDLEDALSGAEKKKEFRFGISRTLGDLALVDPIRALQAKYEDLELQATVDWTGTLIEKLEARCLDAAVLLLRKGESLPTGLHGETIGTRSVAIIRAKRKQSKGHRDSSPFAKIPWIVNPTGCPIREQIQSFFRRERLEFRVNIEADGVELKIALAAQGIGITYVLPHMLALSNFRSSVEIVKMGSFSPSMTSWIAYPRNIERAEGPIRLLRESIETYLGTGG